MTDPKPKHYPAKLVEGWIEPKGRDRLWMQRMDRALVEIHSAAEHRRAAKGILTDRYPRTGAIQ
jgi:hypothetical protein